MLLFFLQGSILLVVCFFYLEFHLGLCPILFGLLLLTLCTHAQDSYSSWLVCLSHSDFGDYWQLTVDLGMNLLRPYWILGWFFFFCFVFFLLKKRNFQLHVGTSCGYCHTVYNFLQLSWFAFNAAGKLTELLEVDVRVENKYQWVSLACLASSLIWRHHLLCTIFIAWAILMRNWNSQ